MGEGMEWKEQEEDWGREEEEELRLGRMGHWQWHCLCLPVSIIRCFPVRRSRQYDRRGRRVEWRWAKGKRGKDGGLASERSASITFILTPYTGQILQHGTMQIYAC